MDEATLPVGMRELLTRAIDEASRHGAGAVEGEHVLLALLADPAGTAARTAAEVGLDHEGFLDALRAERVHSLAAAGITAVDESLLRSTPSRIRQRPTWGASIRTLMGEMRSSSRGRRRPLTELDALGAVLRTELGTVPRALDLAGIDRAALITRLSTP